MQIKYLLYFSYIFGLSTPEKNIRHQTADIHTEKHIQCLVLKEKSMELPILWEVTEK